MSLADIIVPDVIQKSVLAKVVLGVVTIMVLTGAIGGYFYLGLTQDLDDQVDRQVQASTVLQENAYDSWFNNRIDEVEDVTTTIDEENRQFDDPDQLSQFLFDRRFELSNQIRELHYVDFESGEVIASSNSDFEGENIYDLGYGQSDVADSDGFVLPNQYQAADDEQVVAVGQRLRFPQSDDAVLLGEINTSMVTVGPQLEQSIEGAETGVVSGSDDLVIGNEPPVARPTDDDTTDVNFSVERAENANNIYTFRQLESHENLYVVIETPKSSAFALRDTVLQNFGLTLAFAFIILITVILAGGRSAIGDLNRLAQRAEEMGEGDLDVDLETSRKDEIGVLYAEFDEMRNDLKERIEESEQTRKEAQAARKEAEVARAEAEEMATYLQEKAEEYSGIMQEVSMGDLTRRMEPDGEEESMDRIAEEFNDMIEELEKTTGQLKSYVDEVEGAGSEVEQSAETVREASEQVADSIQKISDDAYDQKERLQGISETMDEITDDLEALAGQQDADIGEPLDHIREVATAIGEVAELSEETMAESEHVAGAAEEQAAELNEVSERANDLQRYAQPLRDILERFDTEAEHEFVFSVGPTGGAESPGTRSDDE